MKRETFTELQMQCVNFIQLYCMLIPSSELVIDKHKSQTRKNGNEVNNVPRMKEKIQRDGVQSLPPICVKPENNGKFTILDGVTRALACIELGIDAWVSPYFWNTKMPNQSEIEIWQAKQNDHEIQSANTKDDITMQLSNLHKKSHFSNKFGFDYKSDPRGFKNGILTHCRETYKNSGLSDYQFEGLISEVLKGTSLSMYEAYNNKGSTLFASNDASYPWVGQESGEIYNNRTPYVIGNPDKFWKFAHGPATKKIIENPGLTIDVVAFVEKTVGLDDEGLQKRRDAITVQFDNCQNYTSVCGKKLFSNLYFIPQIKTGKNQENQHVMLKVR